MYKGDGLGRSKEIFKRINYNSATNKKPVRTHKLCTKKSGNCTSIEFKARNSFLDHRTAVICFFVCSLSSFTTKPRAGYGHNANTTAAFMRYALHEATTVYQAISQ